MMQQFSIIFIGIAALIPSTSFSAQGQLQANNNPCQIQAGKSDCSIAVSYTASGAPVYCIWNISVIPKTRWTCQGHQSYSNSMWVSTTPQTLVLKAQQNWGDDSENTFNSGQTLDIKTIVGTRENIERPQQSGDIVGRDLNMPGLGAFGHLGFWDGSQVIEVLNEGGNAVKKNSFDNFASRTNTWPSIHPNIPPFTIKSCYLSTCSWQINANDRGILSTRIAMAARAYQIYLTGADYTLSSYPTYAIPNLFDTKDRITTPSVRGKYRCDTFVMELFGFTDDAGRNSLFYWGFSGNWPLERVITGAPNTWKTNINLLFTATGIYPASIYNRIKTFK